MGGGGGGGKECLRLQRQTHTPYMPWLYKSTHLWLNMQHAVHTQTKQHIHSTVRTTHDTKKYNDFTAVEIHNPCFPRHSRTLIVAMRTASRSRSRSRQFGVRKVSFGFAGIYIYIYIAAARAARKTDLVKRAAHLRLLLRHTAHEVWIPPRVHELRPVANAALVRRQGNPIARVKLARTELLQNVPVRRRVRMCGMTGDAGCRAFLF